LTQQPDLGTENLSAAPRCLHVVRSEAQSQTMHFGTVVSMSKEAKKVVARRMLAQAVVSAGRADDPHAVLDEVEEPIQAALEVLGDDPSASRYVEAKLIHEEASHGSRNDEVNDHDLPADVVSDFEEALGEDASGLEILRITGSDVEGFSFKFRTSTLKSTSAFALSFRSRWVFAPGPVGIEDLVAVTQNFRRHFDRALAPQMRENGAGEGEVRGARQRIAPVRALWLDEADPDDLVDTFPLVFIMTDSTELGQSCFCALEPWSDRCKSYHVDY